MISCRQAREAIVDSIREAASEALRLELDVHLDGCTDCRVERARWAMVATLRDTPHGTLGEEAHQRIVRRLRSLSPAQMPAAPRERFSRLAWASLALTVIAGLTLTALRTSTVRPDPLAAGPSAELAAALREGELVSAETPRTITFGGARVSCEAGSRMRTGPGPRAIRFEHGEIDVEVTPGGPGRFVVQAPRFRVEVIGTRFVVTEDSVRTLHGTVRVTDPDGHELALLHAGGAWHASPIPTDDPAVESAPTPRRDKPAETAGSLLEQARARLAEGDVTGAEALLRRVADLRPSSSQRHEGALLAADALRISGRAADAIEAYRGLAERAPDDPSGETAAFLLGEVLLKERQDAAARRAFESYLTRHPAGRFATEAKARTGDADRTEAP